MFPEPGMWHPLCCSIRLQSSSTSAALEDALLMRGDWRASRSSAANAVGGSTSTRIASAPNLKVVLPALPRALHRQAHTV